MSRRFFSSKDRSVAVRNFIFGIEDSLVSTVGLLSGIATTDVPRPTILLAGMVYIAVEAFSMAVGSFLSEEFVEDFAKRRSGSLARSILGGVIMLVSSIGAALIPLAPYLFLSGDEAFPVSVAVSIGALTGLGVGMGLWTGTRPLARGLRMAILGSLAIGIGVAVGQFFSM